MIISKGNQPMKANTHVKILLLILFLCFGLFLLQTLNSKLGSTATDLKNTSSDAKENFCVICQNQSTFQPWGVLQRKRVECPICYSQERHRLLFLYLETKTAFFKVNLSLLHFAPQQALERKFQRQTNLQYITADLYRKADLKLDIRDIKLPDSTFDVIICIHVLEHVVGDKRAMQEIYRILKPGGWAILQVPLYPERSETYEDWNIVDPEERLEHFGQKDHVRIYGWRDYKDRLEQAGFSVTVDNFVSTLDNSLIVQYGLNRDEDIYVCSKPLQ